MDKKGTWDFKVDVGGTFTDYIGISPAGKATCGKLLSSGCVRSKARVEPDGTLRDKKLTAYTLGLFEGFSIRLFLNSGPVETIVVESGEDFLKLDFLGEGEDEVLYELFSGEEAPALAVRLETATPLSGSLPSVNLCLGTTRGTNALLERKGARVGLICNKGFEDVWEIGTQARPDLFSLKIRKPDLLTEKVAGISGRIDKDGEELAPIITDEIRDICRQFRQEGIESIAVCLINSYCQADHELLVGQIVEEFSFAHVSLSSQVCRNIKLLERGDTAIVDAYLSPIICSYIESIKASMPEAHIKMMTSSGGLISPENFSGKDSLLSGPAGGVNGFVQAALENGFSRSIGFDMGGTSTDVNRYGGEFEYQFETEKAGVRVMTPMYAIETVAAGGGSICHYDGQRFLVGPESAGADPGPACYGAGGPLTVTDLNLFNGKIDRQAFPFELDLKAVEKKLAAIAAEVQSSTGRQMSLYEVADGFTRIADFKMAQAIRDISSAKGYNPQDYLLVAFGGAGPQHACSIAAQLGMEKILIHPGSGILSAYGIGLTGVQLFDEATLLVPFLESGKQIEKTVEKLRQQLTEKLAKETIVAEEICFHVSCDLRYQGENDAITVDYERAVEEFEEKHLQFFGYLHKDRAIELVNLRVRAYDNTIAADGQIEVRKGSESMSAHQNLWLKGECYQAGLLDRVDLKVGERLVGPLILREGLSTIVVEPNWELVVTEDKSLILNHEPGEDRALISQGTEKDPVRLELFNNLFTSIATRMGETLRRISLSVNVKERLDFSCAILNASGELIVNAPHIPVHLGALADSVKAVLREVKDIQPGMVFLTNDPAAGGSHLPDLTVISPVFAEDQLLFFTASRAHHAEIGGIKPGSFCPFASSLEEEGVIFKNFLLADKGGFKEKELREALESAAYPSRSVAENVADLKAALAAGNYGSRELLEVLETYGRDTVLKYMDYMCQAAEEKALSLIRNLPDGDFSFRDTMDNGSPLQVAVTVKGDSLKIDFTGTGPVNEMTMNANRSIVKSSLLYVLRCLIDEDIPLNEGVLKPVELILPESFLNPPVTGQSRAAVSAGNVEVSQKICDVLLAALNVCAASQGTMNNVIFGSANFGFYETLGGGCGGMDGFAGSSAIHSHMTNTRLTDVEIIEKHYPVRILSFGKRAASGGKGCFNGGDGMVREYEFLTNIDVSLVTQRRTRGPFGLHGGDFGLPGENILKRKGYDFWESLGSLSQVSVSPGDVLKIYTPGGGAWGRQTT